jgi:hypothetical protein
MEQLMAWGASPSILHASAFDIIPSNPAPQNSSAVIFTIFQYVIESITLYFGR